MIDEAIEFYAPDGASPEEMLGRATHIGIGAHQDDLEINMIDGILRCYGRDDQHFFGIIATDGRGSPRTGRFADCTDDEMVAVRRAEQRRAADIGRYSGVAFLPVQSSQAKDPADTSLTTHLVSLLEAIRGRIVYTHNLWDKHDTHVAVALRTIEALRRLAPGDSPEMLYGTEGWRDLDWLIDEHKVLFDCSEQLELQRELVSVFESQIAGGKRYDLAAIGRRQSHATGQRSHEVDSLAGASIGIDMTPLLRDPEMDPIAFADTEVEALREDVRARIARLR